MQIKGDDLESYLASGQGLVGKAVVIYGAEPFLAEEASQTLSQFAKKTGFSEKQIFYITARDNFSAVFDALGALSLFSSQKLIEIRFESEKPNKKQGEELLKLVEQVGNHVLIIQAQNLAYTVQKEAWFKSLIDKTVAVTVPRVTSGQFPNWIAKRAKANGLQIDGEVVRVIVDYAEGNLLWAQQILHQLTILCEDQSVDVELLKRIFIDNSVFQVNDLSRLLLTKSPQLYKVVHKLQAENVSAVLLTSILIKDVTILTLLASNQQSAKTIFSQYRIWPSKQKDYIAAQKHYNRETLEKSLLMLASIDKVNKGVARGDAWLLIDQLIYELSQ